MEQLEALKIIGKNAHLDTYPDEMKEAWDFFSGKEHIGKDFYVLCKIVRNYVSSRGFDVVIFQNDAYFGFACLQDNTIWKISLKDAFESINTLNEPNKTLMMNALKDVSQHRAALTLTLAAKHPTPKEPLSTDDFVDLNWSPLTEN